MPAKLPRVARTNPNIGRPVVGGDHAELSVAKDHVVVHAGFGGSVGVWSRIGARVGVTNDFPACHAQQHHRDNAKDPHGVSSAVKICVVAEPLRSSPQAG